MGWPMSKPPVPRRVVHFLYDFHRVSQPLLVAAVHDETDAAAWSIRATIRRLANEETIVNTGTPDAPVWEVRE